MDPSATPGRAAPSRLAACLLAVGLAAGGALGEAQPTPTEGAGEPSFEPFLGTYRAVDLAGQAAIIDEAVTEGTEAMGPLRRRIGRRRLHAVNVPVRVVRIENQSGQIVVDFDGDRYAAPLSGAARRTLDSEGEPVDVSYRVLGRALRGRYVGPDGEKIMDFVLEGGGRMTMAVTLSSDQLPAPVRYELAFRRD